MKLLVLDFLRRWWWLIAITLLISLGSSILGSPAVFSLAAVVALMLDAQRGVFRAVRPMPVSRGDQARAWWFIGVPLLPLLAVPVLAIGVLLSDIISPPFRPAAFDQRIAPPEQVTPGTSPPMPDSHAPAERNVSAPLHSARMPAPWFAAGVQTWVALGYAGFCFFLLQWAPARPPETIAEHMQQGIFGLLWGLSIPGTVFAVPSLPRLPAAIAPWHWAVFIATPVFVILSSVSAADIVQRRIFVTGAKTKHDSALAKAPDRGLTGVPLFLLNFAGRVALIIVAVAAIQAAVMRWLLGANPSATSPGVVMQVMLMGFLFGVVITESIGLRALRTLPLSTPRLALLLAAISWAGALTVAAFAVLWCRIGSPALPPWQNFPGIALALAGWATLTLAITLHLSSSGRIFLLGVLAMLPAAAFTIIQVRDAMRVHPAPLAVFGAVSGVGGFMLLVRGLKKSAAFYRPRGFFGMTPGQPSPAR